MTEAIEQADFTDEDLAIMDDVWAEIARQDADLGVSDNDQPNAAAIEAAKRGIAAMETVSYFGLPQDNGRYISVRHFFRHMATIAEISKLDLLTGERTTPEWAEHGTPQMVPIDDLHVVQETVRRDAILANLEELSRSGPQTTGNLPVAFRINGKLLLDDGHHRVAAMKAAGINRAKIIVVDPDERHRRSAGGEDLARRFGHQRTHKAGSAEAILQHCLRQRGWTKRWRAGRLTGKQRLAILEDIREYGRAWFHHEAMVFLKAYGRQPERALLGAVRQHLDRLFNRAKGFVRELVLAGAMAFSGPEPLGVADLAEVERQVQRQEMYLNRFHAEMLVNPPQPISPPLPDGAPPEPGDSGPEFAARFELYGNSAVGAAQEVERAAVRRAGVLQQECRVLGKPGTEHCDDCPPLADMGWVAIGTLPPIGQTECGGNCLCRFLYRDADGNEFYGRRIRRRRNS
jgi:hypothetical protein